MWKIVKNNGQDLSFAVSSLFHGVVDVDEFQNWLYEVVRSTPTEDTPNYIFDLLDSDGTFAEIDEIIGFVPTSGMSELQDDALIGIAFLRGKDMYDPPISKKRALRALQKCPEIYDRFRHFFPFVELPDMPAADTD